MVFTENGTDREIGQSAINSEAIDLQDVMALLVNEGPFVDKRA